MKFGIMNSPYRDIEDAFKFAKNMNLSFIDLTIEYPVPRRESVNPNLIRKLSKKYGMELVGHTNWTLPIAHEIEEVRKAAANEIMKTADLFRKIGIKKVNVHCSRNQKSELGKDFIRKQRIKSLREIIRHTKRNRQILMLENGSQFSAFKDIKSILKAVPGLKLHLDIGHANLVGKKEIKKFILKGRKLIEHMHIHDNLGEHDDHLFLGMGSIDWKSVFRLLKKIRYDKTITLETFIVRKGKKFRKATKNEYRRYFRKELALIEKLA